MYFKILWFVQLLVELVFSMSLILKEGINLSETLSATTKMISRLLKEVDTSNVLVINGNNDYGMVDTDDLQITVELYDLMTVSLSTKRKIGATILHLRNYAEFGQVFKLLDPEYFLFNGHFIITCDSADEGEMEKIFSKFWKIYIYNVNILVTNPDSPDVESLFTYMPFANGSCNNTKPIRINEFRKNSMQWTTNAFFPKKFKQLNGCTLRFGCYEYAPYVMKRKNAAGSIIFSGIVTDISVMFADVLNYSLKMLEYEKNTGTIYPNKTTTAMIKRGIENEVNFLMSSLQKDRTEVLSTTQTIFMDPLVIVVPPPFLIDPMAKILLPFTLESWLVIGLVALLAVAVITILKYTPKVIHDYVIGSNVQASVLNVFNIFLGGAQKTVPQNSFPRFLLVTFLIFTLIIRTLYQGGVFDILKRDVRTIQLKTIDEYIDREFTFYIFTSLAGRLQGSRVMQRHQVVYERLPYNLMSLNPSFKGVVFNYLRPVLYDNLLQRNNFTLRICPEVMHHNPFVFYFTKNFYLVDEFNHLIQIFDSAGLMDYIMTKYVDLRATQVEANSPTPFNFSNIEGFFTLFYYGCVVALASFIIEILYEYMQKRKRVRRQWWC